MSDIYMEDLQKAVDWYSDYYHERQGQVIDYNYCLDEMNKLMPFGYEVVLDKDRFLIRQGQFEIKWNKERVRRGSRI